MRSCGQCQHICGVLQTLDAHLRGHWAQLRGHWAQLRGHWAQLRGHSTKKNDVGYITVHHIALQYCTEEYSTIQNSTLMYITVKYRLAKLVLVFRVSKRLCWSQDFIDNTWIITYNWAAEPTLTFVLEVRGISFFTLLFVYVCSCNVLLPSRVGHCRSAPAHIYYCNFEICNTILWHLRLIIMSWNNLMHIQGAYNFSCGSSSFIDSVHITYINCKPLLRKEPII